MIWRLVNFRPVTSRGPPSPREILCGNIRVLRTLAAALFCAGFWPASVYAGAVAKRCRVVDVRSIRVTAVPIQNSGEKQEKVRIAVAKTGTDDMAIVAHGPVLGSMDSEDVLTDVACAPKGFVLTATIIRSADYNGAVRQNVLWTPEITVAIGPHHSAVVVKTIWKMRLTNGQEVQRSRTPPYLEPDYPITVTRTVAPAAGLP